MKVEVYNNNLQITEDNIDLFYSGGINYYKIEFNFNEQWNNLSKKAIYIKDEEIQEVMILDNTTYIPKIDNGIYKFGVVGFREENDIKTYQISTNLISIIVENGAGQYDANVEITPTEITLLEKYLQDFNDVIERVDEKIEEIEEKELDFDNISRKIEESFEDYNNNAIQKTNDYNDNAEEKEQELNDIKDVAQSFVSAVTFSTFGIDSKMHLNIYTPKKLGNAGFKLEHGRLKVKYGK